MHALDAKVTLDGNCEFRHPDYEQYDATQVRDEREQAAHDKGLQYVGLEGYVGVIANGAGLAMSTVDIVNQVGGKPANFLDIGGGANADVMAGALEVINNDPDVRSIFINIFGGITKGDEVANGIITALGRVDIDVPIVIRLDGTNADEGRAILEPHLSDKLQLKPTMVEAAEAVVAAAGAGSRSDRWQSSSTRRPRSSTRASPARRAASTACCNRDYGTQVVAGTNPKKAGTDVDGIPVYATRRRRRRGHRRHRVVHLHPRPRREGRRAWRPPRAASKLIVAITEGVPAHDEAWFYNKLKRDFPDVQLLGPNCPGIISPGKANIGITAGHIAKAPVEGKPNVGIVSRSGTLTYQALYELKLNDIGVTTCVGIGGDPVPGTSFIDCLEALRGRPRHQGRDDDRRDRRLGRGGGGRVHRRQDDQAGRVLHRRRHRARRARRWATPAPSCPAARAPRPPSWRRSQAAGVAGRPEPHRGRHAHGRGRQAPLSRRRRASGRRRVAS